MPLYQPKSSVLQKVSTSPRLWPTIRSGPMSPPDPGLPPPAAPSTTSPKTEPGSRAQTEGMDTAASARRRLLRERDAAAAPRPNRQPTCGATATPILPPIHRPQPRLLSRPLDQDRLRLQQSHLHPKPYP
ncbi:hypothetical protein MRB53_012211 [Persea americana]|uniref:Uncharacterized protein n=1 Tax=Persea americana TaxID=3435 RepID=A0ACC2LWX9_PERAE|nr:hypothetical protein MRB53_012211 [Persea americana]|eukprot:TRINITY_DN15600_c0_g1_i1.p1 TRINITY_DN15600_c0_g1~~TRINITY_DN15600_c0_g1_i1.p1  ORF type:complete len:130 (+),score=21.29 TRINITY_DN15600_c0_g1_i1:129-518(+)